MDKIQEIIQTFSEDDVLEFKNFINRLKKKENRKDLELFDLLDSEKIHKREEIVEILYGENVNLEAYHATRKRLIKQLADFIHYKKINETDNNESKALSLYYLSQHLFEQQKDQIGWVYIKKAEQIAENQKLYSILHKIFLLQMAFSNSEYSESFPTIIRKKKTNLEKLYKTDNILTAQKVIKNRLKEVLNENPDFQIELLIKNVIADHELGNVVDEDFDFLFSIIKIVEEVTKETHSYDSFERYLISTYNEFKEEINHQDLYKQLEFLYMIAHTLFMNRKYALTTKYLDELEEILPNTSMANRAYYSAHIMRLRAKTSSYVGKYDVAITTLTNFINTEDNISQEQQLHLKQQLAYCYFLKKEYAKIHELFNAQKHTDQWCQKVAGDLWAVKKKILDALLSYEEGNISEFDLKIRLIQREYSEFLSNDTDFWNILLKTFNKLEELTLLAKEKELLKDSIKLKPVIGELFDDFEANVIFYWFESKCTNMEVNRSMAALHATVG